MTFVKAFEQCAREHPDRLAVVDATNSLTYGELSRRSDVLAYRLIASGVKPGDFVAVKLGRTIAFPLAVIAIHKAGAAYVPIDLEYPEDRQQYMLSDCQAKVVVDSQFMADTDFNQAVSPIDLSIADGLAYMIYTSGSTGKPKGVVLHQAGLWNFINVIIDMEHLTTDDRISGHRSFSFDAHIQDLFPVLTLGGSFHIMPEGIRKDLAAIRDFLFEHQITGGGYTTSMAALLLNRYDDLPVRFMTAGGEKLTGVFSDHIEIINAYGPTECTDDTSYYRIQPGCRVTNIPIGRTVANCYHFIIDKQGRLVPHGAEGELCFAGIQVGCGYWRQPELTAEKFCYCPFLPTDDDGTPVRMFRTGDLCRWNAEGQLEYIGRQDTQVKLRGYRIELGEIESCASKFEGISQAVAVIRPIGNTDTLCLYYTADGNTMVDAGELRQFLTLTLAEYMVPTAYMQMDALPLTPNGKVDRRRLPEPTLQHAGYIAPRNELEKLIVSGFEKVLNQKKISVNDDFVHLGGDSLAALKLVFSLGKMGVTVADVLSLRTPAAIASNVKGVSVNLNRYSIESGCPLNNTQMFIYHDIVKFGKYDSYLIPSLIPIDGKYTDEQIKNALDTVFTAHPVLTMHVALKDGVPYMVRGDKPAVMKGGLNPLKILSLLTSGFDLYCSLSRHIIVRILGRCYLLSVIHHLIFDKVSNNVFYRHFQRALEGETLDFVDDHFLKISSFHQEVKSTEQYAEMNKYISSMLSNLNETNFYRNPGKHGRPGYHKLELGVDREQVNRFTERFGITKNILFTAAMAITLSKLVGNDDVAFGFLDNGRDRFDNFEDIGLYINAMPLVAHVDHHDMRAFLTRLSDVYYELSQNNYFPIGSLAQEFNIAPIILFQFFPDWITENGKHDHLPQNEMLTNKVFSTLKDFMVEALTEIIEMGNSYVLRIAYSGYYSRKMMKTLAKTYKETIIQMLKVQS
jgi:amino acid adenylation domain-containing protein